MKKQFFLFFFITLFLLKSSIAQQDSLIATKEVFPPTYNLNNYNSIFSNYHYSNQNKSYINNKINLNKPNLDFRPRTSYSLEPLNYNNITRSDYYYKFDPANPYGFHDPLEALIMGSINFLIESINNR